MEPDPIEQLKVFLVDAELASKAVVSRFYSNQSNTGLCVILKASRNEWQAFVDYLAGCGVPVQTHHWDAICGDMFLYDLYVLAKR
jgi:hypothetical protein